MQVKLFGRDVSIKDHHCNFNDTAGKKIDEPFVNLYVRIEDFCQASCGFCEFHGLESVEFNEYKFYYMLYALSRQIRINKLSFTGGEPTLKLNLLNRALKVAKECDPNIFTIVNTNGYAWTGIDPEYIDSIALSRHHYKEAVNKSIFGVQCSRNTDILNYQHKNKLHLSCNLIKGQIDSAEEAHKYVDFYGDLGVEDIGFVSLMKRNQFCKDFFVDFDDVKLHEMPNTIRSQHWQQKKGDKITCKCDNFLTFTGTGNVVKSYARYYVDTTECKGMLVYDIDKLKVGFNGEVIFE